MIERPSALEPHQPDTEEGLGLEERRVYSQRLWEDVSVAGPPNVSVLGGMRVSSEDATRTAPFTSPSEIFCETLTAKAFFASLGFQFFLFGGEWSSSMTMGRLSPSRTSTNLLTLVLTLEVSDFSFDDRALLHVGTCRQR